jgi:hypothetical protein
MMRIQSALAIVIVGFAALVRPSSAEACSCGGTVSSSTAFNGADLVFVGTVARLDGPKSWSRVNADGSISGGLSTEPPLAAFEVAHMFRGRLAQQVVVGGDGTSCDEPFKQGETWLVYARNRDGRITTDKCTRTRLRADAVQDLVYLEGLEQGRQQGIVSGDVLRRILGADGRPALQALFEPLQVIAVGVGRRLEITTDKWGPYQLVLPPGDFEIWVERAGRAVASRQTVRVAHGTDRRLALVVDYKD